MAWLNWHLTLFNYRGYNTVVLNYEKRLKLISEQEKNERYFHIVH